MQKLLLYVCSLCFLFFGKGFCQESKENKKHLRTDGFYLYDNGLDTIVVIPGGEEMQMQTIELMKQEGILSPDFHASHQDSIARNGDSSTLIDVIAFFSDSTGTHAGAVNRDKNTLNELLGTIDSRRKRKPVHDTDKVVRFCNISFQNDTTFTFIYASDFAHLESKYTCTFRPHDGLNVKMAKDNAPGYIADRNYIFVPFNNIPPDLLKVKKDK